MKVKRIVYVFVLAILTIPLFSQVDDEINSLFDDVEDIMVAEEDSIEADDSGESNEESSLLDDLSSNKGIEFGADFKVFAGYSPGWVWLLDSNSDPLYQDSAIMGISARTILDVQVTDYFRFLQSYTVSFPDFKIEVSEFFADVNFKDYVYVRVGRQNLTWGISRYFAFTNLHARLPDDFGANSDDIDDNDSFAVKLDVPILAGGFQALMYTRNGFYSDPSAPAFNEMGWGANYNLALQFLDLTAGFYYHKDLDLRWTLSGNTTLFNKLELYSEWMVSYDYSDDNLSDSTDVDLACNLGFYIDFFSGDLELSGEYFYTSEETELDLVGSQFSLFTGHNMAAGFSWKILDEQLKVYSYFMYNFTDNSGFIVPAVSTRLFGFLKVTAAVPILLGDDNSLYGQNNPDPYDRRFSFVITATVTGGF